MSMRYEWDTAGTDLSLATKEELMELADAPDEVESGGLIIGGGSGSAFIIEGEEDDLHAFVMRVMDLLKAQRKAGFEERAGRPIDSLAKIGGGTKVWRITGYTEMGPNLIAHLAPMPGEGFSNTSVDVVRLRDAD